MRSLMLTLLMLRANAANLKAGPVNARNGLFIFVHAIKTFIPDTCRAQYLPVLIYSKLIPQRHGEVFPAVAIATLKVPLSVSIHLSSPFVSITITHPVETSCFQKIGPHLLTSASLTLEAELSQNISR